MIKKIKQTFIYLSAQKPPKISKEKRESRNLLNLDNTWGIGLF
jgi:hypothetical protein